MENVFRLFKLADAKNSTNIFRANEANVNEKVDKCKQHFEKIKQHKEIEKQKEEIAIYLSSSSLLR